jgi:acyl-CoA oxidase
LDGRYRELREQVRSFMSSDALAPVLGLDVEAYRAQVASWMGLVASSGLGVPGFPVEYGGLGDPGGNVAAFETLGHGDLSLLVKFGVQFGLWGGAVLHLGTLVHHERYLRGIASVELPGCFAMTEVGHGSNVQSLETTAVYDPGSEEFVINTPSESARKEYIGGAAGSARIGAVFAQLVVDGSSHGVHCFVVPLRDRRGRLLPGVGAADDGLKAGLNGVDNGQLWFDRVRVPRSALLNRYGDVSSDGVYSSPIENPNKRFFTMLGTLVQGRVCVGAASISASKNALTIGVRYALRRRQFGPGDDSPEVPLLHYRTHQRRLLPLLARTFALHFAQQALTERFHSVFVDVAGASDDDRRELETLAAGFKAAASWHAMETIQTCRECCGGAGYMAVNRFGVLRDDIDIFTTFEGDNTVLTLLCARGVLTGYAHDFGGLNPAGLVTFVAGQAVETVVERLFARQIGQIIADWVPGLGGGGSGSRGSGPGGSDSGGSDSGGSGSGYGADGDRGLRDPDHLLDLFEWRQGHITASVANRFRRGLAEDNDPFEVFRFVQDHAAVAATAYIETFVLKAFADAVAACAEGPLKESLSLLLALYGLSNIEADKGFFQEHGRLASVRTKHITREVNDLCNIISRQASMLVDAFGIPDAVLAAPIGLKTPA